MRTIRLITALAAVLFTGSVFAQSVNTEEGKVSPMLAIDYNAPLSKPSSPSLLNKGTTLFSETFSNGFDGDNGVGPWEALDSSPLGNEIWKEGGSGGLNNPTNFGFGSLTPNFTTSSNGYAFFDCFRYNQPTLPDYESVLGTLTSPSLDFSANSSVIVEYQQIFAYCCFSFSPLTVEVSNDGGISWTVFPGEGAFIPDANTASGNLTTVIDISCAAAFQSDVLIRWAYNNAFDNFFGFYSWCIDDIMVYEAASTDDVEVIQVTNGDVFFIWEYRVTPIQQARSAADGGLQVGVVYSNRGSADQIDAVIDVQILDEGGTSIFSYETAPFDIPANANALACPQISDTVYLDTGFVPSETGEYTIEVTVITQNEDASPANNTLTRSIEYTNYTYGHDDQNELDIEYRPVLTSGSFERFGFGNFYTVPNEGSVANGVLVRFGPNTDEEFEVEVRLYEVDSPAEINPIADAGFGSVSAFYEITAADISPSIANSVETYIEFEDELELLTDKIYFVCVILDAETSPFELTCLGESNSDTDFSTRIVALTGDQESFWFGDGGTPAVRLVVDGDPTGIEEVAELEGVTLGQNMPNPAKGFTTIQYQLERNLDVNFQVMDATGRVVFEQRYGNLAPGQHVIELDLAGYSTGVYQYSIFSGNSRVTRSMVIEK